MKNNQHQITGLRFLISLVFVLTLSCSPKQSISYNAVVNSNYTGKSGELVEGIATYATLTEVLDAVPDNNESEFVIYIKNDRYYEKLSIDKPHITLLGENQERTIITFDATGDTPGPDGEKLGTWGCFTLRITAPDFRAENLTIENSFDYPANAAKSNDDTTKVKNPQAVALMTSDNNDRAVFRNCIISGYQDTFFGDAGRHYFLNCKILGHVDFIFGAGQAVFKECEIVSRNRKNKSTTGYITAPSTLASYPYGFLFTECRFLKENDDLPEGSVCLGRPWHPGANLKVSGSSVFYHCYMDDHIGPKGYAKISSRDTSGTRIWFDLEPDSRFFEYKSYGPGAIKSEKRPTMDKQTASWYSETQVLNSWKP